MHNLTMEERGRLNSAATFDEMADVALSSLARMKREHLEIIQICGPMSTGGCGDFQRNMERFNRAIDIALAHKVAVFNQVVFQDAMVRICDWKEGCPYPMDLLEVFYRRVLSSGYITKGLFLPDWSTSLGARWERTFLLELSIPVEEYPLLWIQEFD